MKKFIIGFLVGIMLSFSFSTYAEVQSLIGRVVQGIYPVKVNGVKLEKQAIVIDGTSYLPVRAIGESLGFDVSFDSNSGIELKQKTAFNKQIYNEEITMKRSKPFLPKSTVIEIPDRRKKQMLFYYKDLDGETYIPYYLFSNYQSTSYQTIDGKSSTIYTLNLPNGKTYSTKELEGNEIYVPGCDLFVDGNITFIKLSLTGYTVREDGDTLIIE